MIISRTPFRVSFFGGGTDYPSWFENNGGMVLSTTINKYCYITVRRLPPYFDYKYRIRYFKKEETNSISSIEHPSVRETLNFLRMDDSIELVHYADVPAQSGLGTSSAFTVGLVNAIGALDSKMYTKRELALNAIHIEQNLIGENVGSQDQVSAAFGGLNKITFGLGSRLEVDPIILPEMRLKDFQDSLLLCFTGFSRVASEVAAEQISAIKSGQTSLSTFSDLTRAAIRVLCSPTSNLREFGQLLNEQWKLKRGLARNVSSPEIDQIYETGLKAGAVGGKLLGAGSGGFMLFFAHPDDHIRIKSALASKMFVNFRFEDTGSKIVYYSHG